MKRLSPVLMRSCCVIESTRMSKCAAFDIFCLMCSLEHAVLAQLLQSGISVIAFKHLVKTNWPLVQEMANCTEVNQETSDRSVLVKMRIFTKEGNK